MIAARGRTYLFIAWVTIWCVFIDHTTKQDVTYPTVPWYINIAVGFLIRRLELRLLRTELYLRDINTPYNGYWNSCLLSLHFYPALLLFFQPKVNLLSCKFTIAVSLDWSQINGDFLDLFFRFYFSSKLLIFKLIIALFSGVIEMLLWRPWSLFTLLYFFKLSGMHVFIQVIKLRIFNINKECILFKTCFYICVWSRKCSLLCEAQQPVHLFGNLCKTTLC